MNTYQLTVTINVEAMHLFPAIMAVQDALKPVGQAWVDWDREDPLCQRDFEGAKKLLAPADPEETDELGPESPEDAGICNHCGNELLWDAGERMYYCPNTWDHG